MNGTKERIGSLLEYKGDAPVVSLYLKLGPRERQRGNYRITLKNLLKNQMNALSQEHLSKLDGIFSKLKSYLEAPSNIEGCGGIAIFASENLFEVFKLPYVYMDRLVVDSNPLTRGLIAMAEEMGTVYFVAVDRRRARIFRAEAFSVDEVMDLVAPETDTLSGERPGSSRGGGGFAHAYGARERVIKDESQRHLKNIADTLFERFKKDKFDWLVIAGSHPERSELVNHLHAFLAERLLGTVPGDTKKIDHRFIQEKIAELMELKKAQWEKEVYEEFTSKKGSGFAVSGLEDVLSALSMGQIKILIVKRGHSVPGFRCPGGRLSLKECEGGVQIPDVVDEIMEECLAQRAEVFVTEYEPLIKAAGDVGAVLRFKI